MSIDDNDYKIWIDYGSRYEDEKETARKNVSEEATLFGGDVTIK